MQTISTYRREGGTERYERAGGGRTWSVVYWRQGAVCGWTGVTVHNYTHTHDWGFNTQRLDLPSAVLDQKKKSSVGPCRLCFATTSTLPLLLVSWSASNCHYCPPDVQTPDLHCSTRQYTTRPRNIRYNVSQDRKCVRSVLFGVSSHQTQHCFSKVKGQHTRYSAAYMSQTQEQQRFTISEVAADWHELMIPQRIMRPSIIRANGQLDPRCS